MFIFIFKKALQVKINLANFQSQSYRHSPVDCQAVLLTMCVVQSLMNLDKGHMGELVFPKVGVRPSELGSLGEY